MCENSLKSANYPFKSVEQVASPKHCFRALLFGCRSQLALAYSSQRFPQENIQCRLSYRKITAPTEHHSRGLWFYCSRRSRYQQLRTLRSTAEAKKKFMCSKFVYFFLFLVFEGFCMFLDWFGMLWNLDLTLEMTCGDRSLKCQNSNYNLKHGLTD